MSSITLGHNASCNTLFAQQIGSRQSPVDRLYNADAIYYKSDGGGLSFVETSSGETRARIDADGSLQSAQSVQLYDGANLETSTRRFTLGLDPADETRFVIRNGAGEIVFAIAADGSLTGSFGGAQSSLTINGTPVRSEVASDFSQILLDDAAGIWQNSLVGAAALRNWWEGIVQPTLCIGLPLGGTRSATLEGASGNSSANFPSCAAVVNYVTARVSEAKLYSGQSPTNYISNRRVAVRTDWSNGNVSVNDMQIATAGYVREAQRYGQQTVPKLWLQLPSYTLFPEEIANLTLRINTAGVLVNSWSINIRYHTDIGSFHSAYLHSSYDGGSATLLANDEPYDSSTRVVTIVAVAGDISDVRDGSDVPLAIIRFTTQENAIASTQSLIIESQVVSLVNVFNQEYKSAVAERNGDDVPVVLLSTRDGEYRINYGNITVMPRTPSTPLGTHPSTWSELATMAYVISGFLSQADAAALAPLNSPNFTGTALFNGSALAAAAFAGVATTVQSGGTSLPTGGAVFSHIANAVAPLAPRFAPTFEGLLSVTSGAISINGVVQGPGGVWGRPVQEAATVPGCSLEDDLSLVTSALVAKHFITFLQLALDTGGEIADHAQQKYAPLVSPTLTGTVTLPASTSIGGVSVSFASVIDGTDGGLIRNSVVYPYLESTYQRRFAMPDSEAVSTTVFDETSDLTAPAALNSLITAAAVKQYVDASASGSVDLNNTTLTGTTSVQSLEIASAPLTSSTLQPGASGILCRDPTSGSVTTATLASSLLVANVVAESTWVYQIWYNWATTPAYTAPTSISDACTLVGADYIKLLTHGAYPGPYNGVVASTNKLTSLPVVWKTSSTEPLKTLDTGTVSNSTPTLHRLQCTFVGLRNGNHQFKLTANDAVALVVGSDSDNTLTTVIDRTGRSAVADVVGTYNTSRGAVYSIVIAHMCSAGTNPVLAFSWKHNSETDYRPFLIPISPAAISLYSSLKSSTGVYLITFITTPPTNNYIVQCTPHVTGSLKLSCLVSKSPAYFVVHVFDLAGAFQDANFDFTVSTRGTVFICGTVKADGTQESERNYA